MGFSFKIILSTYRHFGKDMNGFILDAKSPLQKLALMGGKARNLYLMSGQGLPVPKWCCVGSDIFSDVFVNLQEQIQELVAPVDLNDLGQLDDVSGKIQQLFLQQEISENLLTQIEEYFPAEMKTFAVRSSAVGEDGSDNSFAGQLSTFLYTPRKQLAEKIQMCWASAFTSRAIQYVRLNNKPFDYLKVAVVIQQMVDSEKAGVLFSVNPLPVENFLDEVVITAGFGLGEGIVADKVETDTYIYSKKRKDVVKSDYNTKKTQMVFNQQAGSGVSLEDVPSSKQKSSVLTHKNIARLVGVSRQLVQFYKCEQDVEWAFDKDGNMFITQTRPITTIGKSSNKVDFFFDNSNVVESFPGVNTPWTLSIVRDVYATVFRHAVLRLGISKKRVEESDLLFDHLIGCHQGRMFYNLTHWYQMMRLVPFTEKYIAVWEEMLGVEKNTNSDGVQRSIKTFFLAPFRISKVGFALIHNFVFLDFKLKALDLKLSKDFNQFWDMYRRGDYHAFQPYEYVQYIERFKQKVFTDWDITLLNDIYAFVCAALTKYLIRKSVKDIDPEKMFNDLLYGVSGMDSIAPIKSIIQMARLVKTDNELFERLKQLYEIKESNLKVLNRNKTEMKFRGLFEDHLEMFGDRGVEELKLETLTFRENPVSLIKMVLDYAQTPLGEESENGESIRVKAESQLEKSLLTRPIRRFLLAFFLRMAKRSINYRENFRLHRSRGYGVVRKLSNLLGMKMHSMGILQNARDIYMLEFADVANFAHGISFERDLQDKVNVNYLLYRDYKEQNTSGRYNMVNSQMVKAKVNADAIPGEGELLSGQPCSSGTVKAEVLVVTDITEIHDNASLGEGKILVAPMTDPGWVFLMTVSAGLIVEKGSILSHTAIIGRELGIPTIVGVKGATSVLKSGDIVEMNGETGDIIVLNDHRNTPPSKEDL
jgi:phosphohistidine swiveling domain-containing protein